MYIDRHRCFESRLSPNHGDLLSYPEICTVEMSADFDGSLDAVNASFDDDAVFETSSYAVLEMNGQLFAFSSVGDFSRAGVQGMMASSTFTWSKSRVVDLHSAG